MRDLVERLEICPIISAVHHDTDIEKVKESACEVVFLLSGNLFNLKEHIETLKKVNKMVFVHVDLLEGFAKDLNTIDYIRQMTNADGIITTKGQLIKYAKSEGLLTIQRLFLLDSLNYETGLKHAHQYKPDAVEILPGLMHQITEKCALNFGIPVVTGGFITQKQDIINSLKAGAVAVSTSKEALWYL